MGETYWGGVCDFFCIFGFGAFRDESTEKKIVGLVRVMRGGWSIESNERWVTSEHLSTEKRVIAGRVRVMRGGWVQYFWGESWVSSETWGRAQRREERWDSTEERRQN